MWTEKELSRIGSTFINAENILETICDSSDLGIFKKSYRYNFLYSLFEIIQDAIKNQGTTYYNLRDGIFAPKASVIDIELTKLYFELLFCDNIIC